MTKKTDLDPTDGIVIFGRDASDPDSVVPFYLSGGATKVADGFKPSQYDAALTMDGTAQSVALATGVKLGAGRVYFANQGATTEPVMVAFGTSAANAEANLNIAAAAATTGHYIPAAADAGSQSAQTLGVPALATHYAVANAVAADTQVVTVTQGI